MDSTSITVRTTINSHIDLVWKSWITPDDILKWNTASDDWHTPKAISLLLPPSDFCH